MRRLFLLMAFVGSLALSAGCEDKPKTSGGDGGSVSGPTSGGMPAPPPVPPPPPK